MAQMPLLHLNGSGFDNLMHAYVEALDGIHTAHEKLRYMTPHMRDYYPLVDGNAAYMRAREEHLNRLGKLEELRDEIEGMAHALQDAHDKRTAQ